MLSIRRMTEKDLGPLTALLADERVMRYLEAPFSPERAQAFLAEAGLCEPPLIWAVKDDGGFCGYVIYHACDERSMEIGWVLAPRAWGRGYATELTGLLAARAHATGRDAVIECSPSHAASRRVAEKCGFIVSGTRDDLLVLRLSASATP